MNKVNSVRELEVYKTAFELQQEIFGISKWFPKKETYQPVEKHPGSIQRMI